MNQINVQFDMTHMTGMELAMLQRLVVVRASNRLEVLTQVVEAGVTNAGSLGYSDALDQVARFINSPADFNQLMRQTVALESIADALGALAYNAD
jgi:hypothetical protein